MNNVTFNTLVKRYGKPVIIILIFAVFGACVMGVDAKRKKSTIYTASRQIVIAHNVPHELRSMPNGTNISVVGEDNNMMPTYKDIAENGTIAQAARKNLSKSMKKKYSTDDIKEALEAKVSQQSLVMELKAKTSTREASVKIVNAAAKAMKEELPRLQPGSGKVTLLQKATVNNTDSRTTPSTKKHVIVGFALGALLGLIIEFIIFTVKNFGHKE
ncbi:chain-length determining protein [Limosilactobacillus sp. Sa3CUN2]|uniref:Chain-length determining protein n=1 Tax=Limosilactobacillus avistercoris TaxID=2762243 RepID=A0ABR8PDA7_9LACO|nr:chain-length determining protein [Limosilactobacillus avistercoris]MBD7895216.1 chain-length determining protein [Limosilactobacillus avistercoris]